MLKLRFTHSVLYNFSLCVRRLSNQVHPFDKYEYSYTHGASVVPLCGTPISRLIDEATEQHGENEAVVVCHQNVRKSFIQLRSDVDKLATGLLSLGLKKGDRIGIWAPNMYEWVVTQFATARVGFILVNINPAYQAKELSYALNKVGIKALIAAESFKSQDYYKILASAVPEVETSKCKSISSNISPDLKFVIMISEKEYESAYKYSDIMNAGGSAEIALLSKLKDEIQFDDAINIQFTSGTTGNPKAAILSHHNIVNNSYFIGRRMNYHLEQHRICVSVPLYHCMGNVFGSLSILTHGACAVFPAPTFNAEACLLAIHNEKCTSVYGTPTMFVDMLHHPNFSSYEYTSLKTGIMAGSPCPEELVKAVVNNMNAKDFIIAYGCTETSPAITTSCFGDSLSARATSVGCALDHVEVKVINTDNRIVPVGVAGEICARGYLTMIGYWGDEVKTREVLDSEGWYHTGDQVVMYENGYVQVVGRIKDMIIRGGENIYPREIEEFLHTHPLVAEVHVVGVPDARLGEEVCAWIRLKDGASLTPDDVKAYCKGEISHFKIPRYIKFVTVFPTTVTGKIQKFVIKQYMVDELRL